MALVVSLISDLKQCKDLAESAKSAEKSKVQAIREQASSLFDVSTSLTSIG
jgi:hypothetical protein